MTSRHMKRCSGSLTLREMQIKKHNEVSLHPTRKAVFSKKIANVDEDVGQKYPTELLVEMYEHTTITEGSTEIPQKSERYRMTQQFHTLTGRGNEIDLESYLFPYVYSSSIHNG